jgi:hypothetical protein
MKTVWVIMDTFILKEYGYYMMDGEKEREIHRTSDNSIVKYDWSEVVQLI